MFESQKTLKIGEICGELFKPGGNGQFPLVIYFHGYGYNYVEYSLKKLAQNGIAAYSFDFKGGSPNSRSGGDSLNMSVLSEADDLECVFNYLKNLDCIDENRIYLRGNSQGGHVSTIVGTRHPNEIQKMFLLCLVYVINDDFKKYSGFKGTMRFGNMKISDKYVEDAFSFDLYKEMKKFTNDVVIYHGSRDNLVPISYSKKAIDSFPNAHLVTCEGAGHMLGVSHGDMMVDDIIREIDQKEF